MGITQDIGSLYGLRNVPGITDPTAVGAAQTSLGLGTLATGMNVVGNIFEGVGGAQEARYRASVMDQNARGALLAGQEQEAASKIRYGLMGSEAVASTASRGVGVSGGSAQANYQRIASMGAIDAAMLHANAAREAYGYDTQAALERKAAGNMLLKGVMGAGTSLVGGAYGLSDKWLQYKGTFGSSNPMTLSSPQAAKMSSVKGPDFEARTPISSPDDLTSGIPNG